MTYKWKDLRSQKSQCHIIFFNGDIDFLTFIREIDYIVSKTSKL